MAIGISIVGVGLAAIGLWLTWRSDRKAGRSATAAERSATAGESTARSAAAEAEASAAQAAAAREQLAVDRKRFHQEATPVLEGSIKRRPSHRGGPPDKDHILEVRVSGGRPLARLTLHLPAGTHLGWNSGYDLSYPEAGSPMIGPEHPAIWDVAVGADAPESFTASADCRDEHGVQWLAVEVPVRREND